MVLLKENLIAFYTLIISDFFILFFYYLLKVYFKWVIIMCKYCFRVPYYHLLHQIFLHPRVDWSRIPNFKVCHQVSLNKYHRFIWFNSKISFIKSMIGALTILIIITDIIDFVLMLVFMCSLRECMISFFFEVQLSLQIYYDICMTW